jgi:hypothetical protein
MRVTVAARPENVSLKTSDMEYKNKEVPHGLDGEHLALHVGG